VRVSLRAVVVVAALVAATAWAGPAVATSHFNPSDVYRELRCPTCKTTIDISNAPVARSMKAFVLEKWREGWSRQRVLDAMVEEFGDEVLATPKTSGFDLLAWILPALGIALGLVIGGVLVRTWVRRKREEVPDAPALSDADASRLDRELERFGGP